MTDEITSEAELPLETAGIRLRRAREAAGLNLQQVAQSTKIPERHLMALEAGTYSSLPAKTYATGFARSYARMLGMDEASIIDAVREELAMAEPEPLRRTVQTFEPGDPSRLPSTGLVWIAGLGVVAAIAAAVFFMRGNGQDDLPSLVPSEAAAAAPAAQSLAPAPAPKGVVVFTALAPDIWVKFYDGNGTQLLQKQLAQGESYAIPETAPDVLLWTGRPEALAITIGGAPVPKLSDVQRTLKDVPVTAAALLARGAAPAGAAASGAAVPGVAAQRASSRRDAPAPVRRTSAPPAVRAPAPIAPPTDAVPQLNPAAGAPSPMAT